MGKDTNIPEAPNPEIIIPMQEAANRRAFDQTINAMRPNEITPFGQSSWTNNRIFDQAGFDAAMADWNAAGGAGTQDQYTPGTGDGSPGVFIPGSKGGGAAPDREHFFRDNWTREVKLDPTQQALLDRQNANSMGMADQTGAMLGSLRERFSNPLDLAGQLPTDAPKWDEGSRARVEEALLSRMKREMDPQFASEERGLSNRLLQSGFNMQDQGFGRTMDRFDQRKDRAYADAVDRAILAGGQEASQEQARGQSASRLAMEQALQRIAAQAQDRGRELNEFNAFRTGAQMTMPTTQGSFAAPTAQAVDHMGAAQQQYDNLLGASNAQGASQDAFLSGLMGLGGAFMGGPQGSAAAQLMTKLLG